MAIKYLDAKRIRGTATERTAMTTSSSAIPQTGWKVIARATITGGDNSVIDTGTGNGTTSNCVVTENTMYATPKDNLMVLINQLHKNGSVTSYVLFNNDTSGTNASSGKYADRTSENDEADQTSSSHHAYQNDGIRFDRGSGSFTRIDIRNILNREKLCTGDCVTNDNPPQRWEAAGKWVGTAQINRISVRNEDGGDYSTGDEIIVLGCDDDEADSGTNFWQELSTTTLGSASTTISTGTITAKKYLMVQGVLDLTDGNTTYLRFNSDTGSNYSGRGSLNGATDTTRTGEGGIREIVETATGRHFFEFFIFNTSAKEKLLVGNTIHQSSAGVGNAPNRRENARRWANTSAQITSMVFTNDTSNGLAAGSHMRVWGSD